MVDGWGERRPFLPDLHPNTPHRTSSNRTLNDRNMTIVIIDQFPLVRTGMALFLVEQFKSFTLIESDSLQSFHDSNPGINPDVMILAINQDSELSNLQLICMTKRWYDLKKVIVYDVATDYQMLPRYYKVGMKNYISKQSNPRELKACIDQVLKRKRPLGLNFSNIG